jgi:transaldolase
METIKYLLDSGNPDEYRILNALNAHNSHMIWGSTTNPTLIAKKLAGKKVSKEDALQLQKNIVLEILTLVPGAVSAEVYADEKTTAEEMIKQGNDIASWDKRVVVKLPTTIEGMKARTALRRNNVIINNTLVFSQEQVYAICLHEFLIQKEIGAIKNDWPCFISPFVGRLDARGENGMDLIKHSMRLKKLFSQQETTYDIWILEASVRRLEHIRQGIAYETELITAPIDTYKEWFTLSNEQKEELLKNIYAKELQPIAEWNPTDSVQKITTIDQFMQSLASSQIDISHPLTDTGIRKFVEDWSTIIAT